MTEVNEQQASAEVQDEAKEPNVSEIDIFTDEKKSIPPVEESTFNSLKAEIMEAVDSKIEEMMEKTLVFQTKFQVQEDIVGEMVTKFKKETREARAFINNYEDAKDQIQEIQNEMQIEMNLFKAEIRG